MQFTTSENTSTEKIKRDWDSKEKQMVRMSTEKINRDWDPQEIQIFRELCLLEVSVERTLSSKRNPGCPSVHVDTMIEVSRTPAAVDLPAQARSFVCARIKRCRFSDVGFCHETVTDLCPDGKIYIQNSSHHPDQEF